MTTAIEVSLAMAEGDVEMKTKQWESSKDAVPEWHTQVTIYDEATGERVATVFQSEAVPLIKAAPELLEALTHIRKAVELNKADMKPGIFAYLNTIVEAAIAKAEGRA